MRQAVPIVFGSLLLLTACGSDSDHKSPEVSEKPNTAPVAADDSVTVQSAEDATVDVLANDTDEDGDTLEITDVSEPENGSATVDGDIITYTSNDDFTGTDTFTYTISDGEDEATAEVTVTVEDTVSISGKIVDKVIPDATVTVTVGGETYTTTSNADGDYTLEVSFSEGDELLTINAKGSEDNNQAFVELVSTLPSLKSLKSKAGDDGVLDSSEEFGTNVTNVTTASYALMLDANDGEAPANEESLAAAQEAIDAQDLLEMSAVIKMVIDEGRAMPEGNESTLDFVKKKDAVDEEVEKIKQEDPEALKTVIETIVSDDNLVPKKSEADLPAFYIPTAATAPGFVSKSSEFMAFSEDGTGEFVKNSVSSGEPPSTTFTWELQSNGFYNVTYDSPVVTSYVRYGVPDWAQEIVGQDCDLYSNFPMSQTFKSMEFKVLVEGSRVDVVKVRRPYTESFDASNCAGDHGVITEAFSEGQTVELNTSYLNGDAMALIPLSTSDVEGTWALNILGQYAEESKNRFITDMVTFGADGSFDTRYSEVTGTWELTDAGVVKLMYDGFEQSVSMYNQINGLYGALTMVKDADGAVAGTYGRVVKDNPEVTVTAEDLYTEADEFWFGHINSWMRFNWNEDVDKPTVDQYWGWQFKSPNEVFNVTLTCDLPEGVYWCERGVTTQEILASQQPGWQIKEAGKVVQIDRLDPTDRGDRIRRWHVLDITEDGWMYVLEFDYYDQVPDNGSDDISEVGEAYNRINMMDITKFPDDLSH